MGMDVYGKNPTSKAGEYFRNNVWWWHPLWTFCEEVAPDLTAKVQYGHSNDGDGLDGPDSALLAQAITAWLEDGRAAQYIKERQDWLNSLPMLKCQYCDGTGTRHDAIEIWEKVNGTVLGGGDRPRPESPDFECNACHGHGVVEDWQANYNINVENITEFRDFLLDCGGFEIC